jgi:hypothetical protein
MRFNFPESSIPLVGAVLALVALPCLAADLPVLCADRAAIERVYHGHRTGTKNSFEKTMPPALIEQLVKTDAHKEAVLKAVYQVEITPAMVEAEVRRIETTTRAPEMLAEIKHALGDDPTRFARAMARPIVVGRELRRRFDNDDALHATQRREAEQAREKLLAQQPVAGMEDVTWQLTPRPADNESASTPHPPPPQTKGAAKSGSYTVEATAQLAQTLTPPPGGKDAKLHFEDLDPELQQVLRVQLQKPGDVSAVIETPRGFLVFLAKEKSAKALTAASLSISKRSYEEWLAQLPAEKP